MARAYFAFHLEGLDHIPRSGPGLIACNHASYLDPIANAYAVLRAGRRPRFLAKEELFRAPLLRWALPGLRQIPVRRGTGDTSALDLAAVALRSGEVVVIYPEGTVTRREDGMPMEGKTGVVRLSLATGLPVIPMVSWGSTPVWQKSGRGSLRPRRPVWVTAAPAIDVPGSGADAEDVDAIKRVTAEVMDRLTDLVVDLRARYPERWTPDG
ncbi:MAG TPA: lysophospholipid acyltransferase family protein [Actinomycetota bacterium]|nr:lysophospholipid acyltransferase family protein [Actinomycetota bacterium]